MNQHPLLATELRSRDAWRALRIMSELVLGFEKMLSLGPIVSVFGGTRIAEEHPFYVLARATAAAIAHKGFTILTGAGPGLMEAANRGAQEGGGKSAGVAVQLERDDPNNFIDKDCLLVVRYFFVRKLLFVRYAQAYVILPGGFGTLDEFMELLTLMQTKKTRRIPVFLMGKEYWEGFLLWIQQKLVAEGCIDPTDLDLFKITDDPKEVAEGIAEFYIHNPNVENF